MDSLECVAVVKMIDIIKNGYLCNYTDITCNRCSQIGKDQYYCWTLNIKTKPLTLNICCDCKLAIVTTGSATNNNIESNNVYVTDSLDITVSQ